MIRPPGLDGVAYSEKTDGDIGGDMTARTAVAGSLGISSDWAYVNQVHGSEVARVSASGVAGDADALWTTEEGLPLAIFTADCLGVVLHARGAVGVAHAGWRGAAAGVVTRLRGDMTASGHGPGWAAVGPGIGPCCFEVGSEVAAEFQGHVHQTTWGTTSVDLPAAVAGQLQGLEIWRSESCTLHEDRWLSHRENATPQRMATVGWLP